MKKGAGVITFELFLHFCADRQIEHPPSLKRRRKMLWFTGERANLQMVRVGVYWQEHQNTSVVSSGTQTAHCDGADCSQELKHGSLQSNWGWREQEKPITYTFRAMYWEDRPDSLGQIIPSLLLHYPKATQNIQFSPRKIGSTPNVYIMAWK